MSPLLQVFACENLERRFGVHAMRRDPLGFVSRKRAKCGGSCPRAPQGGEKFAVPCDLPLGRDLFAPWQTAGTKLRGDEPDGFVKLVFSENLTATFDAKVTGIAQDAIGNSHDLISLRLNRSPSRTGPQAVRIARVKAA